MQPALTYSRRSGRVNRPARALHYVAFGLMALAVATYAYVWGRYAVNVPKWDDHALKAFLLAYAQATTLPQKLALVFAQHNEHRIAYDRLWTLIDHRLFGRLDYRHLMVLANLSLLGLTAVLATALRGGTPAASREQPARLAWWYVVPLPYLLLNLAQWENMFWGMASLQNFTVMLWLFWSLYLLAYTPRWGWALALAVLATFTSSIGLLAWPLGGAILLHCTLDGPPLRAGTAPTTFRRSSLRSSSPNVVGWQPLLSWVGSAGVVVALYFFEFQKPADTPPPRGSVGQLLRGWLAFVGAAADAFPVSNPLLACTVLGALLTGGLALVAGYVLLKRLRGGRVAPVDYFVLAGGAFLVGTGAVVAWSRIGYGLETLITSRYKIYSLTLLALLYVYVVAVLRGRGRQLAGVVGVGFSLALAWGSYRLFADEALRLRRWLLTSQFNWTYTQNRPVSAIDAATARLIDNAPAFYDAALPQLYVAPPGPARPFDSVGRANGHYVLFSRQSAPPTGPDDGLYVLLRSATRLYLFPAEPQLNPGVLGRWLGRPHYVAGATAYIPETELTPATYQLEQLRLLPDGTLQRYPTGQTLTAKPTEQRVIDKNW